MAEVDHWFVEAIVPNESWEETVHAPAITDCGNGTPEVRKRRYQLSTTLVHEDTYPY